MQEKLLTTKIREYLKSIDGLWFYKHHGGQFGTAGTPDIIVCYQGRFIAFEVKAEKGRLTLLQAIVLRKIESAGGIAKVVRSVDEVKSIIDSLKIKGN